MKTSAKRGTRGAAVLDAPEEEFASEMTRPRRTGPAPAGALQRSGTSWTGEYEEPDYAALEEPAFTRRKGGVRLRFRTLPKSWWGRSALIGGGLLVLGVAAVAVAEVRHFMTHDPRFVLASSSAIQLEGNHHLTREQAMSVFGADIERNIFRMPLSQRKADLERLPWVEHATVMRLLPNRIRVNVTERTPVAFVRQGTTIGLVDASGVLLDMPMDAAGDPHYSFPVLTGLNPGDPQSTRKARMDVYRAFMQALREGGQDTAESLSEVDVSDPEDVKAIVAMDGMDVLVHFGGENFLERYQQFAQHMPEWKQQYPKLVAADMRYENQIVLDTGAGAAPAAANGAPAADAPAAVPAAAPVVASNPAAPAPKAAVSAKAAKLKAHQAALLARARASRHQGAGR